MDSPPHPPARVCTTTLNRVLSKAPVLRQQRGGVNNELLSLASLIHTLVPSWEVLN